MSVALVSLPRRSSLKWLSESSCSDGSSFLYFFALISRDRF